MDQCKEVSVSCVSTRSPNLQLFEEITNLLIEQQARAGLLISEQKSSSMSKLATYLIAVSKEGSVASAGMMARLTSASCSFNSGLSACNKGQIPSGTQVFFGPLRITMH